MSVFAFSSERKNSTRLSWIHHLSRSSLPSLVTDVLRFDLLRFLLLHQFDVLEKSMLVAHAQLLLQLDNVALEETNDCLHLALSSAGYRHA